MKLPDITFRRQVPRLQSPEAAALPNKLRKTVAAQQGTRQILDTTEDLFDREARLTARSAANQAQREYITRAQEITKAYHVDDSKPTEQYVTDLQTARREVFEKARQNLNSRARDYVGPALDDLDTRMTRAEVETAAELSRSRGVLQLDLLARDNAQALADAPELALDLIDDYAASVRDAQVLDPIKAQARIDRFATDTVADAAQALLDRGDLQGVQRIIDADVFTRLPVSMQHRIEKAATQTKFDVVKRETAAVANAALVGTVTVDDGMTVLEEDIAVLPGLTDEQRGELTRDAKGELAYRFLAGQIMRGDWEETQRALTEGTYADVLTPAQTQSLLGQTGTASTTDIGSAANKVRSDITGTIRNAITQLKSDPTLVTPADEQYAVELFKQLETTYTAAGKTVPQSFYDLRTDFDRTADRAKQMLVMLNQPKATFDKLSADFATMSSEQRAIYADALKLRGQKLDSDPVTFASTLGWDFTPLPDIDAPEFYEALDQRLFEFQSLQNHYGFDIAGPLRSGEVAYLSSLLTGQTGDFNPDAVVDFIGRTVETVGENAALTIFDQLGMDDSLDIVAQVGSLWAQNQRPLAMDVLRGYQFINSGDGQYTVGNRGKVVADIRRQLGGAYGSGQTVRGTLVQDQVVDGIFALYAQRQKASGDLAYDSALVARAVDEYTGGVILFDGERFAPPARGVTTDDFEAWYDGLNADNLPAVVDAQGATIPSEEIERGLKRGWFTSDRLELVQTGRPGLYYLRDTRGVNREGEIVGVPGTLLRDAGDPTRPAVIRYTGGRSGL